MAPADGPPEVRPAQAARLEPIDALRRIAFLLERQRAETRRVEAYRQAVKIVLETGEEQIAQRVAAGTLQELAGIGPSTSSVIAQALAGQVPDKLAELEEGAGPLVAGGAERRAALRGDLHTHSDWSDGGSPIEEMVATALELGHDYLALTDHSPRLKVARGLSPERLRRQLQVVEAINSTLR